MVLGPRMAGDPKLVPPTYPKKANWESNNDGVHEKVNFNDTIWGFDLDGGVKYNKPITITRVKHASRAYKAAVRPGDKLLEINGNPTEKMTLREAHDMIIASGIHIFLKVTAPEDKETTYHCYEDPPPEIREVPVKPPEIIKKKSYNVKTVANWNLQWPWVIDNRPVYSETNCRAVPSRFENKNRHKMFPYVDPNAVNLQPVKMRTVKVEEIEEIVSGNENS